MKSLVLILNFFFILCSKKSYAEFDCIKELPNARLLDFSQSEAGYEPMGVNYANNNCISCRKRFSSPHELTQCMVDKLPSLRKQYENAMREQLITHGVYRSQGIYNYTKEDVEQKTKEFYAKCPLLKFDSILKSQAFDFESWYDDMNRCYESAICTSKNVADKEKCIKDSNYQSQFAGIPAITLFQTKLSHEGVHQQEIIFEENNGFTYNSMNSKSNSQLGSLPSEKILQSTIEGNDRKFKSIDILEKAYRQEMRCPEKESYNFIGPGICVTPRKKIKPQFVTHYTQMKDLVEKFLFKDIAAYGAKKVWESYTISLLMDPKVRDVCEKGRGGAINSIEQTIGFDAYMQSQTNPTEGLRKLKSCFKDLNLGNRIQDLASTAYNYSCNKSFRKLDENNPCAKESDDKGRSNNISLKRFTNRAVMLNRLKERLDSLQSGKLIHQGKKINCGKESCKDYIAKLEQCRKDKILNLWITCNRKFDSEICIPQKLANCPNPDNLQDNQKIAFSLFTNFHDARDMILSKSPELAAKLPYGKRGKEIEIWEDEQFKRIEDVDKEWNSINQEKIRYRYNDALRKSRQKKLDLVMNDICKDPDEFAKTMLLNNPKLIRDFSKQTENNSIGALMCVGLGLAKTSARQEHAIRGGAMIGLTALGAAISLPLLGPSMIYGLTAVSAGGFVGLAVDDVREAHKRLERQKGMHHGCLSDYNSIAEAEEALEDSVFWAAIDFGLAPTAFIGLSSLAKIRKLENIRKIKAIGKTPNRLQKINKIVSRMQKSSLSQQKLIAVEYGFNELGMIKSGKLTAEGQKTAKSIYDLEKMGFSKSQISKMLRNCY